MESHGEMWSYRTTVDPGDTTWAGYAVAATDGNIGRIDDMNPHPERGCLVVDTGMWILGKKRLIPAAAVTAVDDDQQVVWVSLTKDQIKHAPDFDEQAQEENAYLEEHGRYYGPHL